MKKEELDVIRAVATVIFQEGFDRNKDNSESLNYWGFPKRVKIENYLDENNSIYGSLNLSTKQIDDSWYLELWDVMMDDFGCDEENNRKILLYIPIEPERLCWEIDTYVKIISEYLEY